MEEHEFEVDQILHWTDSTIVLQWLHSANKKQPVFVANRVAEILQHSSANKWRHLEGKLNPAAIGTRGMTPEKLQLSFQEEPKPVMRRVK